MFPSPIARAIGAFAMAVAFGGAAQATTLTLDESLDLTAPVSSSVDSAFYLGTPAFDAPVSMKLDVGDKLDYKVMFDANQKLSLQDVQYLWGYLQTGTASSVTETGQLQLLNADGSVLATSKLKTSTEVSDTFGNAFVSADFSGSLAGTTTFYGVRYVGTVDAYSAGVTSRTYDEPGFAYIASPASVPEPAAATLMLAALGLAGAARLRRARR